MSPPVEDKNQRLDSWKEVAAYLNRGVRTVQRWEQSAGLPIHRIPHEKKSSIFAYKSELDAWWKTYGTRLPEEAGAAIPAAATPDPSHPTPWLKFGLAACALIAVAGLLLLLPFRRQEPALAALPLTSYPGAELTPEFSPDGRRLAFLLVAAESETAHLSALAGDQYASAPSLLRLGL